MKSKLWYHTSESMILVTYDIIGLWYHIWSHPWFHLWSHLWYHSQFPHKHNYANKWFQFECTQLRRWAELGRGEEWNLTAARRGKLRTEVWKSWMACALRPALRWQRLQGQGWWWRLIAVASLRRGDRSTTLVVWRHRRIIFGLEAVLRVVLLEVEQAACNLGKKCASQVHGSTKMR